MHSAVAHASVVVKIYLRFKNFPINFTYLFSIVSAIGKINHGYKKKGTKNQTGLKNFNPPIAVSVSSYRPYL